MDLSRLHKWHQSKIGLLTFGLAELIVAYIIGSRAIDTGSLIEYFLTLIFFIGSMQNLIKLIGKFAHGNKQKAGKTR